MLVNNQITSVIIFLMTNFFIATCIPVPSIDTLNTIDALDYAPHPNEILPIQPILLYPVAQDSPLEGRGLDDANYDDDDSEIIYVKLLKRKAYRPTQQNTNELYDDTPRELTMKDIFYVKALTNGKFSQHRIKLYRLPEFYAISIYHKGDKH